MRKLAILLAGFVALNASAQNIGDPRLHVLENGLRVITVEDHSAPLVSAVWTAHVGDSAEPPDFAGNSHYLEHLLLFRGTEKFPKNEIGEWAAGRGGASSCRRALWPTHLRPGNNVGGGITIIRRPERGLREGHESSCNGAVYFI